MTQRKASVSAAGARRPAAASGQRPASLAERHLDQTRQWILAAATDLLEQEGVAVLTNAAVAERAGVSERTVYRHFSTRDDLIDALGRAVAERLATPSVPQTPLALLDYPAQLFASFEARPTLTRAALSTEVFARLRDGPAAQRWAAVQAMIKERRPDLHAEDCRAAAANIRYLLSASTWHYYRHQFGFSAEQTVRCVRLALSMQLQGLGLTAPAPRPARRRAADGKAGPA